ncbi:MAG: hypothetical protein ACPGES_10915 [Coraliomargarita sp.]
MTIEPSLYYPKLGGCRTEDVVRIPKTAASCFRPVTIAGRDPLLNLKGLFIRGFHVSFLWRDVAGIELLSD